MAHLQSTTGSERPHWFYAQQAPARDLFEQVSAVKTNSTPDTPPTQTLPDLAKACREKRRILEERRQARPCCHCGRPVQPGEVRELKDGSVRAYCGHKDCCLSQILFLEPDRSVPVYKKVCVFEDSKAAGSTATDATATAQQQLLLLPQQQRPPQPRYQAAAQEEEELEPQQPQPQQPALGRGAVLPTDIYQLHGLTRPDAICRRCGEPRNKHEACDSNGWAEVRRDILPLPADWPVLRH